ncbi:hypothetical protein Goshw_010664 [Gossypium schwendimanii]|uniref:Uncharacterized protein n=1 Tax=Gossypium schwendimanii TaxID=34291 RepID=A0A7J9LMB3_GOSSC|nr:hypothetical protein [Gossypium schwendimanii]
MADVGFTGCYAYERMCKMSGQKGLNIDWKGLSPDLSLSSKTFAMTGALAWQALAWASFLDGLKVGTSLALDIGRCTMSSMLANINTGNQGLQGYAVKGWSITYVVADGGYAGTTMSFSSSEKDAL